MSPADMTPENIRNRLAAPDAAAWRDVDGSSLLHHAACLGDQALVKACLSAGVPAFDLRHDGLCPRDVARIWGYPDVADILQAAMQVEKPRLSALPYATLKDIRAKGAGVLTRLVNEGRFFQVAAMTEKNGEAFTVDELLGKTADGDSLIFKICQHGQLPDVLRPGLWAANPAGLHDVLAQVPDHLKRDIDMNDLEQKIRQARLRLRAVKPQWNKGPR